MQVRQTRTPSSGSSMRTTRPQRPHAGRTTPACGVVEDLDEPRIARSGARCPSPVSSAGFSSSAHASFCWYEGRGAERRTASATVSLPAPGSRAMMSPGMTATGSRPSSSGHFAHRGRPAGPGGDGPVFAAGGALLVVRPDHDEQYQSWPARWKPPTFLPHCAQAGQEFSGSPRRARRRAAPHRPRAVTCRQRALQGVRPGQERGA